MSCNGCRTLRKGCSDNCVIRPCLEWISSPESQANATMFLAKFYGRTALFNLISASPLPLRPAVFKSLLHEACGRIVNPTYGSVGLFWTGEWARCEAAVEAVLNGTRINDVAPFDWYTTGAHVGVGQNVLPARDLRHVARVRDPVGVERENRHRNKRPRRVGPAVEEPAVWKPNGNGDTESTETVEQPMPPRNAAASAAAETEINLELTLRFPSHSTSG
ncbi:hypothetical protein RIF29_22497 [Crotalaria pallida]|uniref:LOB domain-containing protein n=1 Tax=Crotalaria pallida TaxID=3830 RepID=A0AAN9F4G0_CROPI